MFKKLKREYRKLDKKCCNFWSPKKTYRKKRY